MKQIVKRAVAVTLLCFLIGGLMACKGPVKPGTLEFTLNDDGESYFVTGSGGILEGHLTIPAVHQGKPVTGLGEMAFIDQYRITQVTLPESLTFIDDYAFSGCCGLAEIHLPQGVTSIGEQVFNGCIGLKEIVLPDRLQQIGKLAFCNCRNLSEITIPVSLTQIGDSAFSYCSGLRRVNISDIGAWCKITFGNRFSNPVGLAHSLYLNGQILTELEIPESITSVKDFAFSGCTSIIRLVLPESVDSIGKSAFEDCHKLVEISNASALKITAKSESNGYAGYNAINIYTPASGAEHVFKTEEGYLFYQDDTHTYLMGYTGSKTKLNLPVLPDCEYAIFKYAFYLDGNIESVRIPEGIGAIGNSAFYECSALTKVVLPASVTMIGINAFGRCNLLASVAFTKTDGWFYTENINYSSGVDMDVADPAVNAGRMLRIYNSYFLKNL